MIRGINAVAKSLGPCQPAQSAQADMGPNFSLSLNFLLIDWLCGVWRCFQQYFQLCRGGQCTYPCFPGVLLPSTPYNILSKPLTAFQLNHCRNNGQRWEREEWILSQWLSSILGNNIGQVRDRTNDFLFSSPQRYWLSNGARLDKMDRMDPDFCDDLLRIMDHGDY